MKIPHTIPKIILRAYAPELTSVEQLKRQYQGRILRSEDPTWDENLREPKHLSQQCLDLLIKDYTFFVTLTEERNTAAKAIYEENLERWRQNEKKRQNYERKLLTEQLQKSKRSSDKKKLGNRSLLDLDDLDQGTRRHGLLTPLREETEESGHGEEDGEEEDAEEYQQLAEFIQDFPLPQYEPWPPILDRLEDSDRIEVVEDLDVKEIPLACAIRTIPDQYYWSVATKDRWQDASSDEHNGDWRQAYNEKHLWDSVENFHPAHDDMAALLEQVQLVSPYVKQLTLVNLIPHCFGVESKPKIFKPFIPDEEITGEDDGFIQAEHISRGVEPLKFLAGEDGSDIMGLGEEGESTGFGREGDEDAAGSMSITNRNNSSHIDLSLVIQELTALRKISLIYEMQELGMDFEMKYFDFTNTDVENLAKALALVPTLEHFELNRSRMTDEQCQILIKNGLRKMTKLEVLNLSYNNISDLGAQAVSSLITETKAAETLHTLFLVRNKIGDEGAKSLANALSFNSHLRTLDLRLNYMTDLSGVDFGQVLAQENKSLVNLNLAANRLGEKTCEAFGEMFKLNKSLQELDLSSNELGRQGGELLQQGLANNSTFRKIDIRLANTGVDFEHFLELHLRRNRETHKS